MKILSAVALLLLTLSACSSWEEGWTDEYKQQFKQACLEGNGARRVNPEGYCNCVLDKTMATYPTIAALMENKDSIKYQQALESCK
jgi:PBP1b-binding outer membrane lipoprotein LpoB